MKTAAPPGRPGARGPALEKPPLAARRSRLLDALHVFVLVSFALSQPAYDRLGPRVAFLVDNQVTPSAVLLVIFILSVALPGLLVLAEQCAACAGRIVYEALHGIIVYVLMTLVALPALKRLEVLVPTEMLFGVALAAGLIGVAVYFASRHARAVVTLATPGILIFPGTLLLGSSVTGLLLTRQPVRIDRWNPVPVVTLVFDEFSGTSLMTPDRQIDADRFPNFARLASRSTWYRNATTVFGETQNALPAILSGRYLPQTQWPLGSVNLTQNLFSIIESTDAYELAAFEPVSNLATDRRHSGEVRRPSLGKQVAITLDAVGRVFLFHIVPSGFGKQLPQIAPLWFGIRNSEHVDRAARRGVFRYSWVWDRSEQWQHFLECLEPNVDSTLYFMHLVIPHVNWCYLPSGRRYAMDDDTTDLMSLHAHNELIVHWGSDELFVEQQQLRYFLQLQYVDRMIGQLIDRLHETGLYDRCLLIVAADHGVSFRADHPRRRRSDANQADVLSIPLFVKRPSQSTGEISDRSVESVDILPTITDVLGIRIREPIDGRSVFDTTLPDRAGRTFRETDERLQTIQLVVVDPDVVAKSDFPQLTRKRLGDSRHAEDLYRIGPIPQLVGREIGSLSVSSAATVEIELIRHGDTYAEAPDAVVPCFFEGLVLSPLKDGQPQTLAVAVNGTIRAVTRTYRLNGLRNRWAALVAESSFHPGRNDVQFFAVSGSGPDWQLAPCTVSHREQTTVPERPLYAPAIFGDATAGPTEPRRSNGANSE